MNYYGMFEKWRMRWYRLHTWMVFRQFGSHGARGRVESPVLLSNPERIHVGDDFVACAGCMLSCVTECGGEKYDGEIHIGNNVGMREDVQIAAAARVTLGNDLSIARGVIITDNIHGFTPVKGLPYAYTPLDNVKEVVIGDGVFLGAYCRVSPGITIGEYSVISAGAVVTKNIPPYSMVAGAPGRIIKRYNPETKAWE